jgi:hypothetical protein
MMESADREESENSIGGTRRNPLIQSEEARAKGAVSSLAAQRIQAYERAVRLLPIVEMARRELEAEYHKKFYTKAVSDGAIAKRLNEYRRQKDDSRFAPLGGNDWSGKQVRESLMRAPDRIIDCAVLECRTRMTALALSADFTQSIETVTELEREYLGYIAQALELDHRLNGNAERSPTALLEEARRKAIEVAAIQRSSKELSMMARERLWKFFPTPVRKVFQG